MSVELIGIVKWNLQMFMLQAAIAVICIFASLWIRRLRKKEDTKILSIVVTVVHILAFILGIAVSLEMYTIGSQRF